MIHLVATHLFRVATDVISVFILHTYLRVISNLGAETNKMQCEIERNMNRNGSPSKY